MALNPALTARKLRFSAVVHALETTPKTLRNWFERKQVELVQPDGTEGGWREFSSADVAVLVLVRKLVDFGMQVEAASDFANLQIINGLHEMDPDGSASGLAEHFRGKVLLAWLRDDGEWCVSREQHANFTSPSSAFLTIDLDAAISRAVDRAYQFATTGGSVSPRDDLKAKLQAATAVLQTAVANPRPRKSKGGA